jgi:hypothetical protein
MSKHIGRDKFILISTACIVIRCIVILNSAMVYSDAELNMKIECSDFVIVT